MIEHDNIITSVDVNKGDKETLATSGLDLSIKVWPAKSTNSSRTFAGHFDGIWSVKWNPKSFDILCSCSQDGSVKIWDQRALDVVNTITIGPATFSIAWSPFSDNIFAVGTQGGIVVAIDTRKPTDFLAQQIVHTKAIKSLVFSPHKENNLACGSDDCKVSLLTLEGSSLRVDKMIDSHKDFVRALSWHKTQNILASGSWDKSVQIHAL